MAQCLAKVLQPMPIQAEQAVEPQLTPIGKHQIFSPLLNDKCFYRAMPHLLSAILVLPSQGNGFLPGSGILQQVIKDAGDGSIGRFRAHGR